MRHAAVLLTALCLVTTPLATAGSAGAETWSRGDARGDVVLVPADEDATEVTPAPTNAAADITRISVRHDARRVVVTLRVRDLRPGGILGSVRVLTRDRDLTFGSVHTDELRATFLENTTEEGSGEEVECRGDRMSVQPRHGRVRVVIPRSCLGDPRWVRVGAVLGHGFSLDDEDRPYHLDSAIGRGVGADLWSSGRLPVSRHRVRVG